MLLLAAAAVACTGLAPQIPFRSSAQRSAPRLLGLRMAVTEDEKLRNELDVWRMREESLRGFYKAIVNWKEDGREEELRRQEEDADAAAEATRSAFVASAAAVLVGAFVLRLGGRAALVSLLGLDLVADLGLDEQINSALEYASALGGWTVVGFFAAWIVAKVFLVDVVREPPPPTPSPTRRLGRSSFGRPSCQPSPPSPSATVAHCGPPHSCGRACSGEHCARLLLRRHLRRGDPRRAGLVRRRDARLALRLRPLAHAAAGEGRAAG